MAVSWGEQNLPELNELKSSINRNFRVNRAAARVWLGLAIYKLPFRNLFKVSGVRFEVISWIFPLISVNVPILKRGQNTFEQFNKEMSGNNQIDKSSYTRKKLEFNPYWRIVENLSISLKFHLFCRLRFLEKLSGPIFKDGRVLHESGGIMSRKFANKGSTYTNL